MRRPPGLLVLAAAAAALAACGKKGPPLAPLHLVPAAPADVTAARLGPDVHLRFTVPTQNVGAPGPVAVDRIEVYAVSLAAGAPAPPNRDFLSSRYLVGTVDVRPPTAPGEPAPDTAGDTRPGPGDAATFVEPLTTAMLNPPAQPAPDPPPAPAAAPPGAAAPPAAPDYPTRLYAVRGVTARGRPGNPSGRVTVPLVDLPPPPPDVAVEFTETALLVSWTPPVAEVDGPALRFHVYRAEAPTVPLGSAPTAESSLDLPGVEFGVERCFSVRTVLQLAGVTVGSEASRPACVTPRDIFPPAAPTGLTAVATPGAIALIWDASPEADRGGYLVLRGEPSDDTLQPITPEPIRETSFRDTTVAPGVRYAYAIVAVDQATPPNRSVPSARIEVTAAQ
jgi:predicted small lipoprotein YifL